MENIDKNTQLFLYLVSSFEMAAMQGLGKINNPVDGKIERNLEQAKFAIDVLDMIKDRTKNNVTEYELRFLDTVSAQLKLNYVDESAKKEPEIAKESESSENNDESTEA